MAPRHTVKGYFAQVLNLGSCLFEPPSDHHREVHFFYAYFSCRYFTIIVKLALCAGPWIPGSQLFQVSAERDEGKRDHRSIAVLLCCYEIYSAKIQSSGRMEINRVSYCNSFFVSKFRKTSEITIVEIANRSPSQSRDHMIVHDLTQSSRRKNMA